MTKLHQFEELCSKIPAELDVALLICNAGQYVVGSFSKTVPDHNMLITNMLHPVLLTKALLPRLLNREQRSAIINVSSVASVEPVVGFTLYSASKAYLSAFS